MCTEVPCLKAIVAAAVTALGLMALGLLPPAASAATTPGPAVRCEGIRHVPAAVAIGERMFVAASSDDNVLRVYRASGSSGPVASFDLSDYLEVDAGVPVTISGAARVGDRVYWISSHARDEQGRIRPERYRFFATTVATRDGRVTIEPVGKPSKTLVHKMVERHTIRTLRLDKATRFDVELGADERRGLTASREGLSIEALCASGNAEVLIAFGNPRPLRVTTGTPHALVVPVDNAAEVIEQGEAPIFGEGILWDLDGLGIVSFEYSELHRAYFILAAPHDGNGASVLYRWSGMKAHPPAVVERFSSDGSGLSPETVVSFEGSEELLLLGAPAGSRATGAPAAGSVLGFWLRP